MPRGYWRIVIAALGVALLGAANHPDAKAQPEQAHAQQAIADSLSSIAAIYNEQAKWSERPNQETEPCDPGDDRRYSDLCAQWKAADAAADSAWWAAVSGYATAVSTLLVLVALYIAFRSNWIARDTAKRQLRAYMSFQEFRFEPYQRNGEQIWELQAIWINAGSTPALGVRMNVNWRESDMGPPPDDFLYEESKAYSSPDAMPVGPGCHSLSRAPNISDQVVRSVRRQERTLLVWGSANYHDIFHRTKVRRTEFCFQLKIEAADGKMGVAFLPFGPHNGMDDSCYKQPEIFNVHQAPRALGTI